MATLCLLEEAFAALKIATSEFAAAFTVRGRLTSEQQATFFLIVTGSGTCLELLSFPSNRLIRCLIKLALLSDILVDLLEQLTMLARWQAALTLARATTAADF